MRGDQRAGTPLTVPNHFAEKERIVAERTMPKGIEIGQRFGNLTVIGPAPVYISPLGTRRRCARCLCDCGTYTVVSGNSLKTGNTRSCGCKIPEKTTINKTTHGYAHTPTYYSWQDMRKRCYDPNRDAFVNYGERGIYVCDRWRDSFENFLADMGEKPKGMTLERRDNDGPYSPDNCRWATRHEQGSNKRNNVWVEFQGERMIMTEAIRRSGLTAGAVWTRLSDGWSVDEALNTPARPRRKS